MRINNTPDGRATAVSTAQADEEKIARIYSGAALRAPANWERTNYRLTTTTLDSFGCGEDEMNVLATTIYRRMLSRNYTPNDIIYNTVYIGNEDEHDIADFTKQGLTYICRQAFENKTA